MTLNPEIQVLVLQYNKIKEIGSASFQFHPELETVDLSNNQLIRIQDNTFEAQSLLAVSNQVTTAHLTEWLMFKS